MSRTSISVDSDTKAMLDAIRHEGQSYDGAIRELAEEHMELSEEAWKSIERGMEQIEKGERTRWKG